MFSCRYIKEAKFAFLAAEIKGTWAVWSITKKDLRTRR
jgi:hypothetical protein